MLPPPLPDPSLLLCVRGVSFACLSLAIVNAVCSILPFFVGKYTRAVFGYINNGEALEVQQLICLFNCISLSR